MDLVDPIGYGARLALLVALVGPLLVLLAAATWAQRCWTALTALVALLPRIGPAGATLSELLARPELHGVAWFSAESVLRALREAGEVECLSGETDLVGLSMSYTGYRDACLARRWRWVPGRPRRWTRRGRRRPEWVPAPLPVPA